MFKRKRDPDAPPRKQKRRLADRTGMNAGAIGTKPSAPSPGNAGAAHHNTVLPSDKARRRKAVVGGMSTTTEPAPPTNRGRLWTISVALPGSIVDNAQTHELRSQLVGQVARACAIFNVDEIVVFTPSDDGLPPASVGGGGRGC